VTKVYVYETQLGNAVLLKADAEYPDLCEIPTPDDQALTDPITAEGLAAAARELGYDVLHLRYDHGCENLAGEKGCIVRVYADGEQRRYANCPTDIIFKEGEMHEAKLGA
jgi:hypothetical protein